MKKRNLLLLAVLIVVVATSLILVACDKGTPDNSETETVWTIQSAYAEAQREGFTGTFAEFLTNLSGI